MRFWQFVIEGERQLRQFNLQQSHKLLTILRHCCMLQLYATLRRTKIPKTITLHMT
jgi:hypothetical protein